MTMVARPLRMTLDEFLADETLKEGSELLLGIVYPPMAESPRHTLMLSLLHEALALAFAGRHVRLETPLRVGGSQPRPDLVVFRRPLHELLNIGTYDARDVETVVEFCLSSHNRDYTVKDQLYALGGIPEYLIVNPELGIAELRTGPTPLGYANRRLLSAEDEFHGVPLAPYLSASEPK